MTREELLAALRQLADSTDREVAHGRADELLLDWINDPEIRAAFEALQKWYA